VRTFWNSPTWYLVSVAVGVLVIGSAIALHLNGVSVLLVIAAILTRFA
jgi:uncharacterized membrane protein